MVNDFVNLRCKRLFMYAICVNGQNPTKNCYREFHCTLYFFFFHIIDYDERALGHSSARAFHNIVHYKYTQ